MGALVVGFRYRRKAGVGMSSSRGGMRSSVKGTLGSMAMIDLVRKSSGVIIGVVRLEIDLAADRRARSDAVRFDLKADFCRGAGKISTFSLPLPSGFLKTLKSSSSISSTGSNNGWSAMLSPGGEEIGSSFRVGKDRLPREDGVTGNPGGSEASPMEPSMREGTESVDNVRPDRYDGDPVSLSKGSASVRSSGGLNSKSIGLLPRDEL